MAAFLQRLARRQVAALPTSQLIQLPTFPLDGNQRLPHLTLASGHAHLAWLLHALSASLSTYSSLHSTLTSTSALPASLQGFPDHALLQTKHDRLRLPLQQHQRADEIICLLDVCNALKVVADHLCRQVSRLDHALQSLEEAVPSSSCSSLPHPSSSFASSCSFSSSSSSSSSSTSSSTSHQLQHTSVWRLRRGARRLSACLQNQNMSNTELSKAIEAASRWLLSAKNGLRRMAPPRGSTEQTVDGLVVSQAMHSAALTTFLILAAALSTLAPRSKSSNRIITRTCRFMQKAGSIKVVSPWAAPLTQLQQGLVLAEKSHTSAVFQELQELHASAATLLLGIDERLQEGAIISGIDNQTAEEVKRMRKSAQALQEGLLNLGGDMGMLFQALLDLRMTLLDQAPAAAAACCPQQRPQKNQW